MVCAMAKSERLPYPDGRPPLTRWFSSRGSVVRRGSTVEVFVGGTLVGSYEDGEQFERNAILVHLAADADCHLGRLADAFEMSSERLRQLRREYEKAGLAALLPGEGGGPRRLGERDVARLERMFAEGLRPQAAHKRIKRASVSTVARLFRAWRERQRMSNAAANKSADSAESRTLSLPGVEMLPTTAPRVEAAHPNTVDAGGLGGGFVQHLGTWMLIAFVARLGLYKAAELVAAERAGAPASVVRVGLDATIATFALGEHSLEGVRRLRTPTAKLLLQTPSVPSPDSLRALMDDLSADLGAVGLHFAMLRKYITADRAVQSGEAGVF